MRKMLFTLLLLCLSIMQAQQTEVFCGFSSAEGLNKNGSSYAISTVPHSGTFRVLIVLCKFSDDTKVLIAFLIKRCCF